MQETGFLEFVCFCLCSNDISSGCHGLDCACGISWSSADFYLVKMLFIKEQSTTAWVKVFRIIPEFSILRLTFHRKSASKCRIMEVIIGFPVYIQSVGVSILQDFGNFEL